jgi:3-hydroxyisobutyrate dehydrogenase
VSPSSIIVIGFGALGAPISRRLDARDHSVTVVDRSDDACRRATASGLTTFTDIALTSTAEIVIVLVANARQLLDTARAAVGRGVAGETWIICSTVGPSAALEAATLLADAGADVIDAPVTGGVPGAERGTLRLMAAGPAPLIERWAEPLSVLGSVEVVSERIGDGQATKLVNQLCSSVHLVVAAEAIAFAIGLGLDPARTADLISGGAGSSWQLEDRRNRMADTAVTPAVATRLAILAKDSGLVAEHAAEIGASTPLLTAARGRYLRAAEMDLFEADDSQIIRTYLELMSQHQETPSTITRPGP